MKNTEEYKKSLNIFEDTLKFYLELFQKKLGYLPDLKPDEEDYMSWVEQGLLTPGDALQFFVVGRMIEAMEDMLQLSEEGRETIRKRVLASSSYHI